MKMRRIIHSLLITGLYLLSLPLQAAALFEIYQQARANDPQYQSALAAYASAIEAGPQSRAALMPSISVTAHKTETDQDSTISGTAQTESSSSEGYALNLVQPIYHHDRIVGIGQANAQVARAEAELADAEQALILRVASRYFEVLAAQDDLAFAQAEKKAIKEQLTQTQQRFNVGLTAITDVHEAQARYDQSVARAISAENTLAISRESLRELTGQALPSLSALSSEHPLMPPEPADIEHWVKLALDNNALLNAAEHALEASRREVSRVRAGHYPSLDLVASRSNNEFSDRLDGLEENEETSVSLQLSMPLFQGGQVNSQVRAAQAQYQQARANHEQQRRATEREARSAYLSVMANISQVSALKQALTSSQTALEATQAGFGVGTRTAVDVLDSQRELYRAQRDYASSRYGYILQKLRLKQAVGTLTAEQLKALDPWLK